MTDTPNPNPANLDEGDGAAEPFPEQAEPRHLATAADTGEIREHIGYADVRDAGGNIVTVATFGPELKDDDDDDTGPIIG